MNGASGTLYDNETYQLQVDFPEHYPMEAPQVHRILFFFSCENVHSLDYILDDDDDDFFRWWGSQVIFLNPAPLHPHIYSNGHICLGNFLVGHLS